MERDIAVCLQRCGAPGLTGPVVVALRRSFYQAIQEMYLSPEFQEVTSPGVAKELVIEHLTG